MKDLYQEELDKFSEKLNEAQVLIDEMKELADDIHRRIEKLGWIDVSK